MSIQTLNHPIQGVIVLSGLPGAGKTTAGITIAPPSDLVVLDYDLKDEQRCQNLSIPYFRPEMDFGADPTDNDLKELLAWTRMTMNSIADFGKKGRKTLIIDNGSPLEEAFAYSVSLNPSKFGVNPRNAQSGAYGGLNPGVSVIWQNAIRYFFSNGFCRVVICMHMSQSWANGVPIEKMKVKGNRVLSQLSNLSVVLVRSNQPNQPPVGLIGKEALGLLQWDERQQKYHVSMALPPRIEKFEWSEVSRYIKEFEEGKHTAFSNYEIWTPKEIEQYSPWLSDGQREFILTIARNPGFRLEEGDGFVAEKPLTGPLEALDRRDEPQDWDGLVQYARITCGLDIDGLKRYIRNEFGVFKNADIERYIQGLKNLSTGKQEACPA